MKKFDMEIRSGIRASALRGLAGLVTLGVVAGTASAAPVPIVNADFQLPDIAPGDFTLNEVEGWEVFAPGLVRAGIQELPTVFTDLPPGGQAAYLQAGGRITQNVGAIVADADYTLSFDAGDRLDSTFPDADVELYVGSLAGPVFEQAIVGPSVDGTFVRQSFGLSAIDLVPFAGSDLLISFVVNTPVFGFQLNIDNVVLVDSTEAPGTVVPVPAGLPLLLTGISALVLIRRRT